MFLKLQFHLLVLYYVIFDQARQWQCVALLCQSANLTRIAHCCLHRRVATVRDRRCPSVRITRLYEVKDAEIRTAVTPRGLVYAYRHNRGKKGAFLFSVECTFSCI